MYKHVYCVPTHRIIEEEMLEGYFKEIQFANKKYEKSYPLVIFEDSEKEINKTAICEMNKKYQDVEVFYITRNEVRVVYDKIKSCLKPETVKLFEDLYPNNAVNYGNVLNRIYLFAQLFGADCISRRDSDVLVGLDVDGKVCYPLEYEIDYLGKRVDGKMVFVCGGGYTGKYSLDIESFIDGEDYTNLKKVFSLMSIPEEFHDEVIEVDVLQNNNVVQDTITPDADNFPHCGNSSMFELHRYLPCSPQDLAIGTDCFFIELTALSNFSLALHSRSVFHRHTSERKKEFENVKRYWLGFMLYVDSQVFYRSFYEKYLIGKEFNETALESFANEIADNMKEYLEAFPEECKEVRYKKYQDCIDLFKSSTDEDIVRAGNEFEQSSIFEEITKNTEESVRKHASLVRSWSEVTSVCYRLKDNEVIKNILKDCIIGK